MLYVEIPDKQIFKLMDQWLESCKSTEEVEKMLWYILKELSNWDEVDYQKLQKYCDKQIKAAKLSITHEEPCEKFSRVVQF